MENEKADLRARQTANNLIVEICSYSSIIYSHRIMNTFFSNLWQYSSGNVNLNASLEKLNTISITGLNPKHSTTEKN
jgi:hypothetical protein